MGAATSVDRSELAGLSATEIADLASAFNPGVAEHRQMLIDFGVNGEMLVQLPRHQLADMLHRTDISRAHLGSLLGELDKILAPKVVDPRQLEQEYLRQFLAGPPQEEDGTSNEWDQLSESTLSGVSMDGDERVNGIDCSMGNHSGGLPATLGKMSRLEYLHAGSNRFNGSIPDSIGDLLHLTSLRIDHNNLSGRIPASLTRLHSLTTLDLAWNQLTGTVPSKFGMMTELRQLSLSHNKLNGSLPRELGSMHYLMELRLRENKLAGKVPPLLGNMRSMTTLDLTSNSLQGHIPDSFGAMTALRELWLGDNQFVGPLPETLSKLRALESMDFSSNKLNGKLTSRIFCSLSSLVYLDLSRNSFDGELPIISLIPSWARESPSTDQLPEYGDALSNHSDQGKQCALSYLNLSRNQLTGSIPTGIGELTALDTLDLSYNKLEGGIPPEIGRCISLRVLSLSGCHLSGKLCASDPKDEQMRGNGGNGAGLGGLTKLESLRLDGNIFDGPLPSGFGKLSRLEILQLQDNLFSGCLPSTIGKLNRLWTLVVRNNQLSGRVPPSLAHLTSLRTLRLDGNPLLQGPLPRSLVSRARCLVSADQAVLEDTEATMLGARLGDWMLIPREVLLKMSTFEGYASVRPSLLRHVCTVVPYECNVFADARGRKCVVRRSEIAFFSHCWDLPPDQCPPKVSFLEGPFQDAHNCAKLQHMKACIQDAPPSVRHVWLDMFCAPLAEANRRRATGRSVPFFVQNSGRFYILVPDNAGLQRYKTRAWCRLEALCAACPHHPSQIESAFSPEKQGSDDKSRRFVYDAVECLLSVWDGGKRVETSLGGGEALAEAGFLGDPGVGKLSDRGDRQDIVAAALCATDVMERSGRMDPIIASRWRCSFKKIFYASQKDCWPADLSCGSVSSYGTLSEKVLPPGAARGCPA